MHQTYNYDKIFVMKPHEVVERYNKTKSIKPIKVRIVQRWAENNNVSYTGEGRRKDYNFSEADYQRFLNRDKPGRRWE